MVGYNDGYGRDEDTDPKALCCYGLLRDDTGEMLLRFVEGQPVSHVTTAYLQCYLQWVCRTGQ